MEGKVTSNAPPAYPASTQPPGYHGNPAYPPGPPMAAPMAPPYPVVIGQPPVVVQAVYVQPSRNLGPQPMQITCSSCHQVVLTQVNHTPGALTWLSCGGLFLVGCMLGCCLIPFCVDSLQDVEHRCPNCAAHLGNYKRL
ncbi:LITAF domain-containing protein-like [Leucoraja erinacea]|uniref:LITAF domain-containing protein-like n=1 Tax=Leucoraja erinaceus TaxID=7782 RepID=UPI0024540A17|nr:LITAF domain-containing protein-like [Leucoraja erinacea]